MRALTGVGPSMASGSQTWSGNWALLPTAPQKISRPAVVAARPRASGFFFIASSRTVKFSELSVSQTVKMPRRKPKSPNRLVRKAFFPASAAAGRSNQKPMRR